MKEINWPAMAAWGLDFSRAVNERPLWARFLFWLSIGKYGRREYRGLQKSLEPLDPTMNYGLMDC